MFSLIIVLSCTVCAYSVDAWSTVDNLSVKSFLAMGKVSLWFVSEFSSYNMIGTSSSQETWAFEVQPYTAISFFSCKIYLTYFWLFEKFVSCTSALASKDFLATPSNCNARHKRSVIQHHNIKILGQVPTINFFVVCERRRHTQHVESCLQAITNILSEFINASSFLKRLFLCSHFWLHSPWRKSRQPITAVCKQ